MTPFFSKKEVRELEEKSRIEKKRLEKEILDLKTRHAAEVDQHRKAFDDRTTLINLKLKEAAEERASHDAELKQLQIETARISHAWKDECDRINALRLSTEGERKKQIMAFEKAIVKHKKKLRSYKVRLGKAVNTLDRKREQVAKLREKLAAFHADADQEQ
ncbi:MAG: hypothetical protein AB8G77_12335 [Rhodothermales bacterium]